MGAVMAVVVDAGEAEVVDASEVEVVSASEAEVVVIILVVIPVTFGTVLAVLSNKMTELSIYTPVSKSRRRTTLG